MESNLISLGICFADEICRTNHTICFWLFHQLDLIIIFFFCFLIFVTIEISLITLGLVFVLRVLFSCQKRKQISLITFVV